MVICWCMAVELLLCSTWLHKIQSLYCEECWCIKVLHEGSTAKIVPEGKFPQPSSFFRKSVRPLVYDAIFLTNGLRWKSMNLEIPLVGDPHNDMIGLPGCPGLWILGNM